MNKVQTIEQLDSLLDADKGMFEDFVRYASSRGVKPVRSDIAHSREVMEAQLRAYIGRNTALEDDAFYHSIFPIDNVVKAALEWIKNQETASTTEGATAEKKN